MGSKPKGKENSGCSEKRHIWPTFFAGLALIGSVYTLYLVHLEPAKIDVFPAERIGFGYGFTDQTVRVFLPIVLANHGARVGVVQSMGLLISDTTRNESENLLFKWDTFWAFDEEFILKKKDRAIPVSLLSNSSQIKYVAFEGDSTFVGWTPKPKTYDFRLLIWTKEGSQPNIIRDFRVSFSKHESDTIGKIVRERDGHFMWIARDEWGKWQPKVLSAAEYNDISKINN